MNTQDYVTIGAVGLAAYLIYKQFDTNNITASADRSEQIGGIAASNLKPIRYGSVEVQPVEQSSLDPSSVLIREVGDDGSLTTYKVPASDLTPYEDYNLRRGSFNVSNGALSVGVAATVKRTISSLRSPNLKLPQKTTAVIPKKAVSTLDNKKIRRTVDSSGSVTTYKGTTSQILVGKAVSNVKTNVSKITSIVKKAAKSIRKK